MKFATVSKSMVMGLALLLASSAFAAGNKANLQVQSQLTVNGSTLKPGDYKVEWEGSGPNVELSILQGKKVVAKVPAHLVDLQNAPSNDAAVVKKNEDGTNTLAGVRIGGKKYALEVGESSEGMQSGSSK